MNSRSANKIKFTSYDELFGEKEKGETGENQVIQIPLKEIHTFKNHPFRVVDDEKMFEMVESIKQYGVLVPAIVRLDEKGGYELIAGHRRKRASELAGILDMPVIVRKLTDDEAVIVMVDSNIQRDDILPSEKAWAYRMKMEALNHQGIKGEVYTADLVGEAAGESGRTVQRFIRLTLILKELMELVDQKRISLFAGEKISYLPVNEQEWVLREIQMKKVSVSGNQAEILKRESGQKTLTEGRVREILKKNAKTPVFTIPVKKIRQYFPADYTNTQIETVIFELLEKWNGVSKD